MSQEMIPFKVCDSTRKIRKIILSNPSLRALIAKARTKKLNGVKLVLEEEGHEIDDNEVLIMYHKANLMLLSDNEQWVQKRTQLSNYIQEEEVAVHHNIKVGTNTNSSNIRNTINTNNSNINSNTNHNDNSKINTNHNNNTNHNDNSSTNHNIFGFSGDDTTIRLKAYVVPWHLIRIEIMDFLRNGQTLPSIRYTEFIHFLADDIRQIAKHIKYVHLEEICTKITEKYPASFTAHISGSRLTDKPIQMIVKLRSRLTYLRTLDEGPETAKKRKFETSTSVKTICEENESSQSSASMEIHVEFLNNCSSHPEIPIQEDEMRRPKRTQNNFRRVLNLTSKLADHDPFEI